MEVLNSISVMEPALEPSLESGSRNEPAVDPAPLAVVEPFPLPLEGARLVQTVVSLTDLPDPLIPLMRDEMSQMLEASGHSSQNLTLEELRASMLAYLEELHASVQE